MPRLLCVQCGYGSEYSSSSSDLYNSVGTTCPKCCSMLHLQVEKFNVPSSLTDAEDLDNGDPFIWDKETQ